MHPSKNHIVEHQCICDCVDQVLMDSWFELLVFP
jgi:hypothetical protein